jgi:agmatinase
VQSLAPPQELARLLRPAGGGLYLVSSGRAEQLALQRRIYAVPGEASDDEVNTRWRAALDRIAAPETRVVVLGVPSDVGAGYLRGANLGPRTIRARLLERTRGTELLTDRRVVDAGDVFVIPQLLHDDMLSEAQITASRRALYPDLLGAPLPVSPLSILERALDLVFALNPSARPFVIGGDHSCAWPVAAALARQHASAHAASWGIVQVDAHTDLLEERLGVKYCFATWSWHASHLFDRPDKMVQIGVRATRHPRAHWESTVGVVQKWANEANAHPEATMDAIAAHLEALGVRDVYFSNDIDGTDARFADATGTPEPDGLSPELVVALIRRLGASFRLCAGDVMEVAPPLARTEGGAERTVDLAARYTEETLAAMLQA